MFRVFILLILALSLHGDVFEKGSTSLGVKLGSASVGEEDYTVFGLSGSYFLIDRLSVGLGYEGWYSGVPRLEKLTLESHYYVEVGEDIYPYVGAFYRRIMISEGIRDTNAYGYRLGAALIQDNLLIGLGVVQEYYSPDRGIFDGEDTYVELTIGLLF